MRNLLEKVDFTASRKDLQKKVLPGIDCFLFQQDENIVD